MNAPGFISQQHLGSGCLTTYWHQQEQQGYINPFTAPVCKTYWHQQEQQGYINPFTAPVCKVSGLKDARMHLQTVHLPVR